MEDNTKADSGPNASKEKAEPNDNAGKTTTTKPSSMHRQNSNTSISSLSNTAAASPNNSSDHSNSGSNISNTSNMSSAIDNNSATEALQDVNSSEKPTKKKSPGSNSSVVKEEGGNSSDKPKSTSAKSSASNTPVCNLALKEETMNPLSVKKEENSLSPASPVGFDAITNVELNTGRASASGKLNELTGTTVKIEKSSTSPSGCISGGDDPNPSMHNTSPGANSGGGSGGGNAPMPQQPFVGNNPGNGSGNCLDYMQQQNHIFVFSTQLANKGAEAVLSGQFQTIIAYHCTQPATKNFLEDFFMKNPMKMTKLRHNALNISLGNNHQWMSGGGGGGGGGNGGSPCGGLPKLGQQAISKVRSFNVLNANNKINRPSTATSNITSFPDSAVDPESELMCWEPNRTPTGDIKPANGAEQQLLANKGNIGPGGVSAIDSKVGVGNDPVPSLQGVKVPDENLTPQQRQHREEQLAKLKKMNQFLFPENDALQQGTGANQQLPKLPTDAGPGGAAIGTIMMNMPGTPGGPGQLNAPLRSNILNQKQPSAGMCDADGMPSALVSGGDAINPDNIAVKGENLNCDAPNAGIINALNSNVNLPGNALPCGPGMLISNAADAAILGGGGFNQGCGSDDGPHKVIGSGGILGGQDVNQMEWSKLQHQYMDDRVKGNKPGSDIGCIPPTALNRLNSVGGMCTNIRPNLPPTGGTAAQRTGQGPPPPYHSTQRSASVPIATQSPNPSSPNNPTSNLSLPSPASSGAAQGLSTNSPNMEMGPASANPTNSAGVIGGNHPNSASQLNKNAFPQEGSPIGNSNTNRNRGSHNQLGSNPGTPLSHMSPKDLDAFGAGGGPDPQQQGVDGRFPNASPGFSFPPHMQGNAGALNNYKPPLERQGSAPGPNTAQFGRRTDNLPLNPNSNRAPQNKLGAPFDPITSLAQMSQQLTSCVPGVGNSAPNVGAGDLNMPSNMGLGHQNVDGMLHSLESGMMDSSGMVNMPSQLGGGGGVPFGPNSCNMNTMMMGPMASQHRLLNPKMCGPGGAGGPGGFNNGGNNGAPGNFHGVIPPPHHHRMRMPGVGFGNFNVAPNIQVKASTPNTIQYMPVRPQNNNNMRAPPSLDFLQRYANPGPMSSPSGPGVVDGGHMGQMNPGAPGTPDGNKMMGGGGPPPGMNFFPHCNQLEQDDMGSGNDVNMGMMRGMRPAIRHHNMGPGSGNAAIPGPRMLAPNLGGPVMSQDGLECGDGSGMFGGGPPGNPPQLFQQGAPGPHKGGKAGGLVMGGGLCANLGPSNAVNLLPNEHNGMPSPLSQAMMGPNVMAGGGNGGGNNGPPLTGVGPGSSNMNYKPFVGPTTNDLKYAQQYHSFQQQLYATSTRSQQQNGNGIGSNMVANNAQNANPAFFVNK